MMRTVVMQTALQSNDARFSLLMKSILSKIDTHGNTEVYWLIPLVDNFCTYSYTLLMIAGIMTLSQQGPVAE
jgi:hypothetical protein